MAQCALRQLWLHATFLDDDVARGVLALRHLVVGDVRNVEKLVCHVGLSLVVEFLKGLVVGFQLGHLGLYLLGLVSLSLFHQSADLLRELVLLLLVAVELLLRLTAYLVVFEYFFHCFARVGEVLLLQTFYHALCLFGNEL